MNNNHLTAVEIFCTGDHCIFGWMSQEWVRFMLMFGLWIGVVCIAGANYAVSFKYHISLSKQIVF